MPYSLDHTLEKIQLIQTLLSEQRKSAYKIPVIKRTENTKSTIATKF